MTVIRCSTNGIATQADVEAMERVPLAERDLPASTYAMLRQGASQHPDKVALRFFLRGGAYQRSVDWTFAELMMHITQAANLFHELGVQRSDVVSYILPNLPETHAVLWGAETAGIANPINPLLDAEAMAGLMRAAETKVLVTLAPFPSTDLWEKVQAAQAHVPTLETILTVDLSRYLSGVQWMGVKAWSVLAASTPSTLPGGPAVRSFRRHLRDQPASRLQSDRVIQPDEVASLFHTGGTTGQPKLAQRTHRNEVYDAWAGTAVTGLGRGETILCGLPLFHAHAALILGLAPWSRGATVVLATPKGYRDTDVMTNFWLIAQHYDVNVFSGVPTVFSALLDVPTETSDTASVDFALCGAAPMPIDVHRRFENETGIPILEGYGLTEATCVSSVNPRRGERRIGSVGLRLPYQEMKVAVLDAEGGYQRDCAPGEVGTLLVRGPNVFQGYRQAPPTDTLWVQADEGGDPWLNTGDLGRQDEEGYFWITGRRKELIIRGGHNIDPKMIEDPLHEHPAVELAAAVGRPDAYAGELPVAYVQLRPEAQATEEKLLDYARDQIVEQAAVPKRIRVIDEMPKTAVGKIFKPALQRREIANTYRRVVLRVDGVKDVKVDVDKKRREVEILVETGTGSEPQSVRSQIEKELSQFTFTYTLALGD
jgi:fatty-acyl-CoA synthase